VTNPFALPTETAPVTAPNGMAAPAPVPPPAVPAAPAYAPGGEDPFSAPAPQQPKGPRIRDMYGRLLLVIPQRLEKDVTSQFKDKDGNRQVQDRMTADVICLDGGPIAYGGRPETVGGPPHDKTAQVPHRNVAQYISNAGLISQCRDALAKRLAGKPGMVLGRLQVGEAKGNNNPPYLLAEPTEADKQLARQYLATVDPFA